MSLPPQPDLSVRTYQQTVDDWIKANGGYFKPLTNLGRLVEETGEVARLLIRTEGEQSFKPGTQPADLKAELADELADVIFTVACLANHQGLDLAAALQRNLDLKGARDASRHANNPKLNIA